MVYLLSSRSGRLALVILLAACGFALQAQIYVQDSPAAAEMLAAAEDRLSKEEPDEAARLVQQVLDEHGTKLLDLGERRYTESRRAAEALLKKQAELHAMYVQLHEPLAAQMLAAAGNDRTRLGEVVRRYGMTEAGLTASLHLAGLSLESGEGNEAAITLSAVADHPLLDEHRATWTELSAVAALLQGEQKQYETLQQQVRDEARRKMLQDLAASLQPPPASDTFNPLDPLPAGETPTLSDGPLWTRAISGAESYLVESYRADQNQIDTMADDGRYLNVLPVISGGVMYVNDGRTIYALEPSSGFELWNTEVIDTTSTVNAFAQTYNRWLPFGADLSTVDIAGDRLVALAGYSAMVTVYQNYYRNDADSTLVVLDRDNGELLWKKGPADIAEDLSDGFWYGRPIVANGRVYATLRLRQRTQFTDAWLISFDLHSGDVLWMRHLASTASDRQSVPRLAHMALYDGWLYVDTCLGTVAKVSAADGAIAWLNVSPIGEDASSSTSHRPWQVSAPVLVDAGLVVLDEWSDVIRLYDPATGEIKRMIPTNEWHRPLYIVPLNGDVLAIGPKVVRFDGSTLSQRWILDAGTIKGRGAIMADRLLLPADAAVSVIDLEAGKVTGSLAVSMPANVLALDGQLLTTQRTGLSSYSSWDVASRQLEKRIGRNPKDAGPLMAMSWLAFRTDREDELLKSLDRAIDAVNNEGRPVDQTQRLFDQIMQMTADTERVTAELRQKLFDRLASVTNTPDQEVAYRLAYASALEELERYADAVEQYQTILAEPTYRRRLYTHDSGSRQAALEAQRRLADILKKHGRELYAPFDAFAQQRLAELREEADPAPLIELAEAYPLSSVTVEALVAAAERSAQQQRLREAIALLRRAAQLTADTTQLGRLYGRQAELYVQIGQPHRARRILRSLAAAHPNVTPIRADQPIKLDDWLAELAQHPEARGAVARVNLPLSNEPTVLEGRLLRPLHQDPLSLMPQMLLLRNQDKLELHRIEELKPLWSADVAADDESLLSMDRQRIWLASPMTGRLRMLDAETGKVRWEDDGLRQKLDMIRPATSARPRNAAEAEFRQLIPQMAGPINRVRERNNVPGQLMIALSDVSLAVADNDGRVIVLNSDSGKIAWQGATAVRSATHLLLDGRHLILAGSDEDGAPVLCVYDAQTGLLLHRLANDRRQSVLWMGMSESGLLVYVSPTQIEAFDLDRGQPTWTAKPGTQMSGNDIGWLHGDRLVVWTAEYDLLFLDMADGRVISRVPIRGTMQTQDFNVVSDGETWVVAGSSRCVGLDRDGKILWQDAVSDPMQILDMLLTDRHVLMLSAPMDGQFTDAKGRRLYIVNRTTGVIDHQHRLAAPQHLDFIQAMDGKLLLSGDSLTAVLTGAP